MPSRTHLPEPLPGPGARTGLEPRIEPGVLALRVAAVPDCAPPYDCETHGAWCPAASGIVGTGQDADPRATVPAAAPASPAPLTTPVVPAGAPVVPAGPTAVTAGATAVTAGASAAWPRQFAQVLVEVMAGSRPARQIFPWTTDRARAQLRRLDPLPGCDRRPRIQRVVTSRPTARVVEMTVVVNFGARTRALAMRFEHAAGRQAAPGLPARPARWLCTEIEAV
jgi:hypothetical protein